LVEPGGIEPPTS